MTGNRNGRDAPGGARRALAGQIVRYALVGGFVTALQAITYWVLARHAGAHPQVANAAGYLVAVASGYGLHGRITFQREGAGKKQGTGRAAGQAVRFVAVSLLSLALNALWVALTTVWMGWPLWSPIPLMALATPAMVFVLNRQWVFRARPD